MNNELRTKTKRQLIKELELANQARRLLRVSYTNSINSHDKVVKKYKDVIFNLEKKNKLLNDNLSIADSDYRELRRDYEYAQELNKGNERTFVWFTFSALFNAVFIAIIVMLLCK